MRIICFLFFISLPLFSVCQEIQTIQTFSSRINNPVRVEEISENGSLVLMGENDSWFPYQVEITFNYLQNLSPVIRNYKGVLMPGKRQLLKFRIISQNNSYSCPYSIRYLIGYARAKADTSFIYSIPLTEGTTASPGILSEAFYKKIFSLDDGDTIVAMRKGIVTETANVKIPTEQLFKNSTIEILHDDNTVSIYKVDPQSQILVREGEKIYPLQSLAIVLKKGNVAISLFEITKEGSVKPLNYELESQLKNTQSGTEVFVKHSQDLIDKEMNKKEKKKWKNGTLYN